MAALGTFTLLIDGARLGGAAETTARIEITPQNPSGAVKDADADKFWFRPVVANVGLPYSIDLPTDVASGGDPSTVIGYTVKVTTSPGARLSVDFAARAAGSTVALTDVTETVIVPVSDSMAAADRAETAAGLAESYASDAEDAAASLQPGIAGGVATLDAVTGELPEAQVPDRLSATGLNSAFAKKPQNTIALIGDSQTNLNLVYQNYAGTDQWNFGANGWFNYAQLLSGHRFKQLFRPSTGEEFAVSGLTAAQIMSTGLVDEAIAAGPGWAHVMAGTNDIHSEGVDAATTAARVEAIVDKLLNAGIRVILGTILPRTSATAAQDQTVRDTNALLRTYAATRPGLVLNDWFTTCLDPTTGKSSATYLYDGTHPGNYGGQRMGLVLSRILSTIAPGTPKAIDNSGLLSAWYAGGTGGGWSGSNPGGATGVVPAGGTCYVDTGTTVVGSKVARTDEFAGEWFQLAVSAAAGNAGLKYRQKNTAPGSAPVWGAGDTIYAVAEIQTDAAGWAAKGVMAQLASSSSAAYAGGLYQDSTVLSTAPVAMQAAFASGIIRTPNLVVPAGWTNLFLDVGIFGGAGTLRIGRMQVYKA